MFNLRFVFAAALAGGCVSVGTTLADDEKSAARLALLKTFASEFVAITPGEGKFPKSFEMGSQDGPATEQPVHEVTIQHSFSFAKYEVPQNLYEAVMGNNPSKWKGKRNSVEMMTFDDAVSFCGKLTKLLQEHELINKDDVIRLPTEAEWEYCCRAGTKTVYSFGDQASKPDDPANKTSILNEYAWHNGNAAGNDPPVGAKKPNPWGLYDMHGYLWEFTADTWVPNFEDAPTDGSARQLEVKKEGPEKVVIRSGSWKDKFPDLRSSARKAFAVDQVDDAVGFRCVKSKRPSIPAK